MLKNLNRYQIILISIFIKFVIKIYMISLFSSLSNDSHFSFSLKYSTKHFALCLYLNSPSLVFLNPILADIFLSVDLSLSLNISVL
jgi:hypothetical protein